MQFSTAFFLVRTDCIRDFLDALLNKLRLLDSLPCNAFCPSASDKISGSALKDALVQKFAETEDFYITASEYSSEEEIDEQMPMETDTNEDNLANLEANGKVVADAVDIDCTM